MNIVIPEHAELKLKQMLQADELSKALREFMVRSLPDLPSADDEEIVIFAERYAAAMERLRKLSDSVNELNENDNISPETEPQCEQLRLSIRANLEIILGKYTECKKIVEGRKALYQRELFNARKKQNLSAYLQSSLIGQSSQSVDKRK